MILSDRSIIAYREHGRIIIDPYVRENVNTSSYDVTLGPNFYRETEIDTTRGPAFYNIYDKEHTDRVWSKAETAIPVTNLAKPFRKGISDDAEIIVLRRSETILAHTNEFIGGVYNVTTMMKARSSFGRNFIEVCKCAGYGDVGYFNRWTMEITNISRFYNIPLVVGMRLAQIVFMETSETLERTDYHYNGKYQTDPRLEQLKATWKPEMMLPKLYNDRELKRS